ncbi:GNAT family N-acetyltransferase [Lacihabitans sp. LS3-19]|uniref:GNAT family N-acetyltransferase n=1 Tax=Lacihabitans sp. LS3-19 TaxID=2487335 RepID=UPI0020CD6F47|nr:GNAT family N-acetyltransferase [Lacihabitans sp. LS3-19]MCP9770712.1 GNAT family N-acetyltransferase [Lacihabitans sp. LS3-19]
MVTILKTNSQNPDFISLVKQLDAYLAVTDGDEHAFYDQFNKIVNIKHVLVFYENDQPIACGAIKQFEGNTWEIKRMFTVVQARGKGIASKILAELENWAKELEVEKLILETGKRQTEAIALYHKNAYSVIENYGQYVDVKNSVCFEKLV